MKRNYFRFGVNVLLCFLITLFSCSDQDNIENNEEQILSLEKLGTDSRYEAYVNNNEKLLFGIKDIDMVNDLSSKDSLNTRELEALSQALGFNTLELYKAHFNEQKDLLLSLEEDYHLTAYEEDEVTAWLSDHDSDIVYKSNVCVDRCNRTARNCIIGANAGAAIGHVSCLSADITIVAGIICHAAVAALHYTVQDECLNQQEQCNEGCIEGN